MSISASEKLDQISRKRVALEQLLLLAHQLSRMQGGMGMLQQMLKPSQAPGRKASAIELFCARMERHNNSQLQEKLGVLDRLIARELSSVVVLSRLTQAEFIQRYCESKGAADAAELLEKQLSDFRRNGQLNVAIRYVLHGRGVQLKAAELPIAQELVAKCITTLRSEEQQCRQRLKQQAQELLFEVDGVLANIESPATIKAACIETKSGLEHTLRLLETGRNLEELPLQLNMPPRAGNAVAAAPAAVKKQAPKSGVKKPLPRRSFWQKLRLWLNTPWRTRWKDLDSHR